MASLWWSFTILVGFFYSAHIPEIDSLNILHLFLYSMSSIFFFGRIQTNMAGGMIGKNLMTLGPTSLVGSKLAKKAAQLHGGHIFQGPYRYGQGE